MARNPAAEKRTAAQVAELKKRCYELRLQGWTVREVAAEVGVSRSTVSNYCKAEVDSIVKPLAEEFRQYQDEQLDKLLQACMPLALNGSARHAEMVIRLLERRAKLHGLDRPTEINATVTEISQYDQELAELGREAMVRSRYGLGAAGLDRSEGAAIRD